MAKDKFLIAPIKDGMRTDLKPWLLPESAFEKLSNAYMYEGRIKKRFGSVYTGSGWATAFEQPLFSRLAIELTGATGTTDINGDAAGTVPGSVFKVGQLFSIGDEIYTVFDAGAPGVADMLTTSAGATVYTYDTTNGNYVFEDATPNTQVYFYPAEPVMGFANFETNFLADRPSVVFDTEFAYEYTGGAWIRIGPTAGVQFNGNDSDFFKSTNWRGLTSNLNFLFTTNFNASVPAPVAPHIDDPMWRYDGTGIAGWNTFQPIFVVAGNFVRSARIIVPFKDRLLLLNTIENDAGVGLGVNTAYTNRVRFSHNGSPLAATAYYEYGEVGYSGGGYIEAPTKDEIVSAEFVKDRLIVYFEKSIWEIAFTDNQEQPFIWQKINTELGSESTFSTVPFDKVVLSIGTTGINACTGANVDRIDNEIPDQIFEVRNANNGPLRVAGVRDYFNEIVYWTYPISNSDIYAVRYPNNIIVYNYKDGTWAVNDDSITAFGYFDQSEGTTWDSTTLTWQESNFEWNSGTRQPGYRQIIAGNQQGFVFQLEADIATNAEVLQITDANAGAGNIVDLYIVEHNLNNGDFIEISNCQGSVGLNNTSFQVTALSDNEVRIQAPNFAGAYEGGGTAATISRIDILTKRYNPYIQSGQNITFDSVDFAVQRTAHGQITVDNLLASSGLSMAQAGEASGANVGNNLLTTVPYDLVPLEQTQRTLWHRVYFLGYGDNVQFRLYFTDEQMLDSDITQSMFQLEGFILNMTQAGRVD